jgi:MSHA biogenesis protein MshO
MTIRFGPYGSAMQGGFTLVEAVMVIVLTGIIAAVVAVFIQGPVQGYFDTVRRSQSSDVADFALRRIARDLQTALPNSMRNDPSQYFLEFLPVRSAGRYRAAGDGGTDLLDIANPAVDDSFGVLSPGVSVASGDSIVIYNTGQNTADAYAGTNRRAVSSTTPALPAPAATNIVMVAGAQFPRHSSSYRFQVVSTPVTYACEAATGTLWRYSGYPIQAAQPVSIATLDSLASVVKAALATNVVCPQDASNIGTGFQVQNADGLVLLRIQLRDSAGESVSLYREVHVDNAP